MKEYTSKVELTNGIKASYKKYIDELENISEDLKDKRFEEVDRTPAENLAYQVGWITLLLKQEKDEKASLEVHTPTENFKWNNLTGLYKWFNKEYSHLSLAELKSILNKNISDIYKMIDEMSEDELFKPHQRKWADNSTKTAVWEVCKFIHINNEKKPHRFISLCGKLLIIFKC